MSFTTIVALLQSALLLLTAAQSATNLPQSFRNEAITVAQEAISQATLALSSPQSATSTAATSTQQDFTLPNGAVVDSNGNVVTPPTLTSSSQTKVNTGSPSTNSNTTAAISTNGAPPLSVTLGQVSTTLTSAYLSWSTDIPSNSKVFLAPLSGGSGQQVFPSAAGYSTQGFVDATGLTPYTQYSYEIEAINGIQDQQLSGTFETNGGCTPIPAWQISTSTFESTYTSLNGSPQVEVSFTTGCPIPAATPVSIQFLDQRQIAANGGVLLSKVGTAASVMGTPNATSNFQTIDTGQLMIQRTEINPVLCSNGTCSVSELPIQVQATIGSYSNSVSLGTWPSGQTPVPPPPTPPTTPTFPSITVTSNPLNGTLVNGSQTLEQFSVSAGANGSIGLDQLGVNVAISSPSTLNGTTSVSNLNLYAYTDPGYSMPAPGFSNGLVGNISSQITTNVINLFTFSSPVEIPAGTTYYFKLTGAVMQVTGTNATHGAVQTYLAGDSSNLAPNMYTASGLSNDNFVWSPNANGASTASTQDWTNGYGLPGLPATGSTATNLNN
jgi:hypothetical protein